MDRLRQNQPATSGHKNVAGFAQLQPLDFRPQLSNGEGFKLYFIVQLLLICHWSENVYMQRNVYMFGRRAVCPCSCLEKKWKKKICKKWTLIKFLKKSFNFAQYISLFKKSANHAACVSTQAHLKEQPEQGVHRPPGVGVQCVRRREAEPGAAWAASTGRPRRNLPVSPSLTTELGLHYTCTVTAMQRKTHWPTHSNSWFRKRSSIIYTCIFMRTDVHMYTQIQT